MRRSGFKRKYNKFGAIKTWHDGHLFDSQMEANHYQELRLIEAAGIISDLEIQKEIVLTVNDRQICIYYADFFFFMKQNQRWTVGETKGVKTPAFSIKWKLAEALYPEWNFMMFRKKSVNI